MLRLGSVVWISILTAILASRLLGNAAEHDLLAFACDRDENSEIYIIDIRTRLTVNVTNNTVQDAEPAWGS